MKKFMRTIGLVSLVSTVSNASVDVSSIRLDVSSVEVLAGVILGALAILWVARKVVSFLSTGSDNSSSDTSYELWQQGLISYETYVDDWMDSEKNIKRESFLD